MLKNIITSHFANPNKYYNKAIYPIKLRSVLDINKTKQVIDEIKVWPNYNRTALYSLGGIAKKNWN